MKHLTYFIGGILAFIIAYTAITMLGNRLAYDDALRKSNQPPSNEICASLSARTYENWLIFNPPDHQAYYFRSQCFQKLAVQNRDAKLCDEVVEYKSLFFNGAAISKASCLAAVKKQADQDFGARVLPETIHRIARVEVNPTPAGDWDVRVFPAGTLWGSYQFSVTLLDTAGKTVGLLNTIETHLSDRQDPLFVTLYGKKIRERVVAPIQTGQSFTLHIKLRLLRDDAGQLKRSQLTPAQLESTATAPITF